MCYVYILKRVKFVREPQSYIASWTQPSLLRSNFLDCMLSQKYVLSSNIKLKNT